MATKRNKVRRRDANSTSGSREPKTAARRGDKVQTKTQRRQAEPRPKTGTSPVATRPGTKQSLLIELLNRNGGATIAEAVAAIGWQAHSIRGAISGTLKKKLGLAIASEADEDRGRVYRIKDHG